MLSQLGLDFFTGGRCVVKADLLDLLDYRRRVAEMYRLVREQGTDSVDAHAHFRRERDELFRLHIQSPLDDEQKSTFKGERYYDYDPSFRVVAALNIAVEPTEHEIMLGGDGRFMIRQFGQITLDFPTGSGTLGLFWITAYGGGLFLPFRDATNDQDTFGGGRYLLDTIKGADLGTINGRVVLDFNYAYHPSCCYNSQWICPLAPPLNTLDFPVTAGEMLTQL